MGMARSGTTYVSRVLLQSGIKAHHEGWGPEGGVGYNLLEKPAFNVRTDCEFVLHLVRDPRYCIPAMMANVRSITQDCHRFWLDKNLEYEDAYRDAEKNGAQVGKMKLERIEYDLARLVGLLEKPITEGALTRAQQNKGEPSTPYRWEDLEGDIVEKAKEYGYFKEV